jgi:hypothetical protein
MRAITKLMSGWSYHFTGRQTPDAQDTARRSTFNQYQTTPVNDIAGRGTLVSQNGGLWGQKYFSVIQPPQVMVQHMAPTNDFLDAGTRVVGLYGTSLLPNPDSTGIT